MSADYYSNSPLTVKVGSDLTSHIVVNCNDGHDQGVYEKEIKH